MFVNWCKFGSLGAYEGVAWCMTEGGTTSHWSWTLVVCETKIWMVWLYFTACEVNHYELFWGVLIWTVNMGSQFVVGPLGCFDFWMVQPGVLIFSWSLLLIVVLVIYASLLLINSFLRDIILDLGSCIEKQEAYTQDLGSCFLLLVPVMLHFVVLLFASAYL